MSRTRVFAQSAAIDLTSATDNCTCCAVYVLDPKILFNKSPIQKIAELWKKRESRGSAAPYVSLRIPRQFVKQLSQGQFELGDMDNPGNSWVFGQEGELFEQKLLGSHAIESGFTSIVSAEALDELQSDSQDAVRLKLPTWEQFKQIVHDNDVTWPHPQLQPLIIFAGHMIESDTGSVYQNPASGSNITGLTISTNSEEVD